MPRKKGNKKNNTLSKKNIYNKKDAKSQAKQISALNKKIKRVYKEVAPEVKTFNSNLINISTIYNSDNIEKYNSVVGVYKTMFDTTASQHYEMKGDMMRVRNVLLYGSFGFNKGLMSLQTNNPDVGMIYTDTPYTAYIRLIICRLKKGAASALPTQITQNTNSGASLDGSITSLSLITGPLIDNISSTLTIIKQKIIKIGPNNPCRAFKIKLGSSLIHKNNITGGHFDTNEILVYYQYVCPHVLQYFNGQTLYRVGPLTHFELNYKVAFTDDD